jgi:hypothetical protein
MLDDANYRWAAAGLAEVFAAYDAPRRFQALLREVAGGNSMVPGWDEERRAGR